MLFPPQGVLAGAVHADRTGFFLHEDPRYRRAVEALIAHGPDVLRCSLCSFEAPRAAALERASSFFKASATEVERGAEAPPLAGVGLFAVHHRNHDHQDYSPGNLVVVCEPCHHAQHLVVGGMEIYGEPVFLGGLSQAEIILTWRLLCERTRRQGLAGRSAITWLQKLAGVGRSNVSNAIGDSGAGLTELQYQQVSTAATKVNADATRGLVKGLKTMVDDDGGRMLQARPSAGSIAHYAQTCSAEEYEAFQRAMPDLRFMPDDSKLIVFIDFASELSAGAATAVA